MTFNPGNASGQNVPGNLTPSEYRMLKTLVTKGITEKQEVTLSKILQRLQGQVEKDAYRKIVQSLVTKGHLRVRRYEVVNREFDEIYTLTEKGKQLLF